MDSVTEGIGASQVLAYVERLGALGVDVNLHTFEKHAVDGDEVRRLSELDVRWVRHDFGSPGSVPGLGRVLRAARAIKGASLVHARSELAAAAVLVARTKSWIWDMRSLYADQKIQLGELSAGSLQHLVLERVAKSSAERASAVVVLAGAVIPELQTRYGHEVAEKVVVIPTCVDLQRFKASPLPTGGPRLLLAGTINAFYDVPTMLRFVTRFEVRHPAAGFDVVSPGATKWDDVLRDRADTWTAANPKDMPVVVARAHAGLCVCRADAGVSLKASMPTKIAEFLATGRPVVVNPGLGDAEALIKRYRGGVMVDPSVASIERGVEELSALLSDPETPDRCRAAAEQHFDLDRAVHVLLDIYDAVRKGEAPPPGLAVTDPSA